MNARYEVKQIKGDIFWPEQLDLSWYQFADMGKAYLENRDKN